LLFPRLALVGVGYIGGSVAWAARRAGLVEHVVGYDPSTAALAAARQRGIIDRSAATLADAVSEASLVLLAAPVGALPDLLRAIGTVLPSAATVMDVGSVKSAVVAAARTALPKGQFVGCHPLAGAEFSGVEHADPGIFSGRVCFVCPTSDVAASAVAVARAFWAGIGCAVVAVAAEAHDRLMAGQSHLPHVAAFALAAALAPSLPLLEGGPSDGCPTTSLRDTTRIAASSPSVWRDIMLGNAHDLLPLIAALEAKVRAIRLAIGQSDGAELERLLTEGQSARLRLVKP
jgi:prephenate dehydrogenase